MALSLEDHTYQKKKLLEVDVVFSEKKGFRTTS